jgi:hypothetical protein
VAVPTRLFGDWPRGPIRKNVTYSLSLKQDRQGAIQSIKLTLEWIWEQSIELRICCSPHDASFFFYFDPYHQIMLHEFVGLPVKGIFSNFPKGSQSHRSKAIEL